MMTRPGTLAPILILLLVVLSCSRFTGGSTEFTKPTKVVDFSAMAGKTLLELTTLLGQATPTTSCFEWELSEGKLTVCYESRDYAKKLMSSISYQLDAKSGDKPGYGAQSPGEFMQLINIDPEGRQTEDHRKGFVSYTNFVMNGRSFFVDIHPRSSGSIFASGDPIYTRAQMFIHNPHIYLHPQPDRKGIDVQFYEQQANV